MTDPVQRSKKWPGWVKVLGGVVVGGGATYGVYRGGKHFGLWGHDGEAPALPHSANAVALPPADHPSHPAQIDLVVVDRKHPRQPGSVYVILSRDGLYEVTYRVDHDGITGHRIKTVPIAAAHARRPPHVTHQVASSSHGALVSPAAHAHATAEAPPGPASHHGAAPLHAASMTSAPLALPEPASPLAKAGTAALGALASSPGAGAPSSDALAKTATDALTSLAPGAPDVGKSLIPAASAATKALGSGSPEDAFSALGGAIGDTNP